MYKRDFDTLLRSKKLPNAILLWGENTFFIQYYAKKIEATLGDSLSVLKQYHTEYNFEIAKSHLGNRSLFDDANLLIIRTDKKIPKKEIQTLLDIIKKSEGAFFILQYQASDTKEKSTLFSKKNLAENVRFFEANPNEIIEILREESIKIGLTIADHLLIHLHEQSGSNLSIAINELEKLSLYNGNIDNTVIDQLIFGATDLDLSQFYQNVFSKVSITNDLKLLLDRNEDEVRVITGLQNHLSSLFLFFMYAKVYGGVDSKEILGYKLPPKLEKERAHMAISLKQHQYSALFSLLQQAELSLKTKNIDKISLLLETLIKIKSLLV
jgi:DNA polymerase III subunit delta